LIVAWRLVKARYAAEAFSGEGARLEGGRWNPKGTPVVYLADHPALAALEMFVHLGKKASKIKFSLFRVEIPKEVKVLELFEAGLPAHWRAEPPRPETMMVGEKWFHDRGTAVLKVPSVLVPAAANLIMNPGHPDTEKLRIGKAEAFSFDPRMWK
jgi:RES domain-containing protein